MLNLPISPHLIHYNAVEICRQLQEHDYQAFIVGGCVRDLILGDSPQDFDIATNASPKKIMSLFPNNIPTGLQHGTITVCMGKGEQNHFEITTFRIEGEYSDGRRPDEVFFVMNIEQDLTRRDLTINAMAYDPISHQFVDPYGGINDLQQGIIRAVGKPEVRFQEDGLRIIRAARFAARFGYHIERDTFEAMKSNLPTLKKVAKERINAELTKILMSPNPNYGLQILRNCDVLDFICPLLLGEKQLPHYSEPNTAKLSLPARLAALYYHLPIDQVRQELQQLKFANNEIRRVSFFLQLKERFEVFQAKDTVFAFKSFMAALVNHSPDPHKTTLEQFVALMRCLEIDAETLLLKYCLEVVIPRSEMVINGDDLLAAGFVQGIGMKKILDACYLEILKQPEHNNKPYLLDLAQQFQNIQEI